jgi:hypothetical protein
MRDQGDNATADWVGTGPRGRGRPRKPDAMTPAERKAAQRQRQRDDGMVKKEAWVKAEYYEQGRADFAAGKMQPLQEMPVGYVLGWLAARDEIA